ncbi:MAG: hypothetical protein WCR40_00840 [Candidatus Paceibacterota bacterium]|nr:hypothetical protein [Candidatus Paceibacterota bacterium]
MEENNRKEESMPKFTYPNQFEGLARELIPRMIDQSLNAVEIPDSEGQVIIRERTPEYDERLGDSDIVMFPIKIKIGDVYQTFYICSR